MLLHDTIFYTYYYFIFDTIFPKKKKKVMYTMYIIPINTRTKGDWLLIETCHGLVVNDVTDYHRILADLLLNSDELTFELSTASSNLMSSDL